MSIDHEALGAKTQETLIDFLRTELTLGPTLVQTALLAKSQGHMDHYAQAKTDAVKAAESVRRFMDRITDGEVRTEIGTTLAELDRLISTI